MKIYFWLQPVCVWAMMCMAWCVATRGIVPHYNGFLDKQAKAIIIRLRLRWWRNRQTRQVEGLVRVKPRVGSNPTQRTKKGRAQAAFFCVGQLVILHSPKQHE